ncbi:tail assembly protein, partial [Methylorubrum sp. POS3]
MLRTVHLYGGMAEQFGPSFRLAVRSLAEAVRALGCQLPGFRQAIE